MSERVAVMHGYEGPPASVDAGKVDEIKELYTQAVYVDDWDAVEAYERVLCLLHDMPFDPARRMVVVLSDEPTPPEQRWGDEPLTERFPVLRPYRILVTGSRDWDDWGTLCQALDAELVRLRLVIDKNNLSQRVTIVHGGCPTGADAMASQWVARQPRGVIANTEIHPVPDADWRRYGRSAGPKRNELMVKSGADVCMAFIKNNSRGATGCMTLAKKAGIPTQVYRA